MLHAPTSENKTKNEANNSHSQPVAEQEHRLHPPSFGQSGLISWGRGLGNNRQENLQKTLGNQAALRMNGAVLQRKCACGGSSAGECAECQSKQGSILQTKLSISEPGDRYEQEADRVADEVMRMPEPTIQRQVESEKEGVVQRKAIANSITPLQSSSTGQDQVSEVPQIVNEVLRSPGQPLESTIRNFMEPRFGHDFSQVRVHTDAKSAESARAVNAQAYTVKQDIVFDAGKYASESRDGKQLLAHELTHVVQQSYNTATLTPSSTVTTAESKADDVANTVVSSQRAITPHIALRNGLARQPNDPDSHGYFLEPSYNFAQAERELPLPKDGVFFDGNYLSIKQGGLIVSKTRAISGNPEVKEHVVSQGPIPDGTYFISPHITRASVTKPQTGVCGADGIGSGYQKILSTEPDPCVDPTNHLCTEDCSSVYGEGTRCSTPVGCWGEQRIAIEGSRTVQVPGSGKATRSGFYIHGGKQNVTVTSGCIKVFDDTVFDILRKFKTKVPLVVEKLSK